MHAKQFGGRTISEATEKVKACFGPHAMILATRKLRDNHGRDVVEITAAPPETRETETDESDMGMLKAEMMSLREMVYLMHHSDGYVDHLMSRPDSLNLYATLVRSGIRAPFARRFMEMAGGSDRHPEGLDESPLKRTIREIASGIDIMRPFDGDRSRQIIAALIGTTGVGKTTTIAKLAAKLMLEEGKSVGLISVDTYRIAAMEQLKTYATILGVPCIQAFKTKDLRYALNQMSAKDVVLIDTAGQSQYDRDRIRELEQMIPPELNIDTHLLLNITTAENEMNATAEKYAGLNYKSYIFTKTDEARNWGGMINQIVTRRKPISYITTGQNVPEDIEPADPKKIIARLLHKN